MNDQRRRARALVRFVEKVHAVPCGGCWQWTGAMLPTGYGRFWSDGRNNLAHRWAYLTFVGPVPDGLVLDHLCRNRACVNPDHMEPVTTRENILRGVSPSARYFVATHCKHGHEFTPENTYVVPSTGFRRCLTCCRARQRVYDRKRRPKVAA